MGDIARDGRTAAACTSEADGAAPALGAELEADLATRRTLSCESIAHLAHELRTPLSAIASSAELMADERFGPLGDPRYKSYVEGIERSARHLLDVIEQMLSGAAPPAPRAGTDLALIAAAAMEHVRTLAEVRRGAISLDTEEGLRVPAAPTALRQMLINLLANALNHAGLEPVIVVRSGRDTNGAVWIEIVDDGPGIPPSLAAQMIGRQGANAGTAVGGSSDAIGTIGANASIGVRVSPPKGHGLGLSITSAMARENGAVLSLHPVAPHGTRARLTFGGSAAT